MWCKETCDADKNCKGYSGSVDEGIVDDMACHLATTSACENLDDSCTGSFVEDDGPIDPTAECGVKDWTGCYIKQ